VGVKIIIFGCVILDVICLFLPDGMVVALGFADDFARKISENS
jgi:hypothetical protein